MRIAYICSDFGVPVLGAKGASIHVRELTRALRSLGHEVLILSPRTEGEALPGFDVPLGAIAPEGIERAAYDLLAADPRGGVPVAGEVRALLYAVALRERGRLLLRDFRPDVIYERYSLFGLAGAELAAELGVPLIVEVNAPLSEEQAAHRQLVFGEAARRAERELLRSAHRLVAVSPALERWLVGIGVPPERVTVVRNGVDPSRFETPAGECARVRAELGLGGEPVVGFLGTLKPWHDLPALIRAVALLRRSGVGAHLLVIGEGPERATLEALVQGEGLAPATRFVGAVPHERVPAYLGALDVAVAPYARAEDFYFSPLKLFEYMAAGRPVVAAAIGEIGHCVRPGETGFLYPPGDARALAEALRACLKDAGGAALLGQAGREHVRAFHTWRQAAQTVTELARAELVLAGAA
jgi:glycosyltransferase involved in cell wall biosynthesis